MSRIIEGLVGKEVDFFLMGNESHYRGTIKEFDGVMVHFSSVTHNMDGKWEEESDIIANANGGLLAIFLKKKC